MVVSFVSQAPGVCNNNNVRYFYATPNALCMAFLDLAGGLSEIRTKRAFNTWVCIYSPNDISALLFVDQQAEEAPVTLCSSLAPSLSFFLGYISRSSVTFSLFYRAMD